MTCPAVVKPRVHAVDYPDRLPMDFWNIYDQYYDKVRRFILAYVKDEWLADDLIQETFVRVQKNLDSLKDSSKTSSWIFRIAHNLCHDHYRQSRRSSLGAQRIQQTLEPFEEALVQKELERQQMGECVQDKMDFLPQDFRTVLILSDIMAFSHKEIAEILDISVSNIKVRIHRARRKFRSILEEHCSFEVDERSVLVCEPVENNQ